MWISFPDSCFPVKFDIQKLYEISVFFCLRNVGSFFFFYSFLRFLILAVFFIIYLRSSLFLYIPFSFLFHSFLCLSILLWTILHLFPFFFILLRSLFPVVVVLSSVVFSLSSFVFCLIFFYFSFFLPFSYFIYILFLLFFYFHSFLFILFSPFSIFFIPHHLFLFRFFFLQFSIFILLFFYSFTLSHFYSFIKVAALFIPISSICFKHASISLIF